MHPMVTPSKKIIKHLTVSKQHSQENQLQWLRAPDRLNQVQTAFQPSTGDSENIKQAQFNKQPTPGVEHNEDFCILFSLLLVGSNDELVQNHELIVALPMEPVVMSPMQQPVFVSSQITLALYDGQATDTSSKTGIINIQAPAYNTRHDMKQAW